MGVTLSGGQKARITLARAVYSSADILLLDDIFAALESISSFRVFCFQTHIFSSVHTSKWIVDNCLRGDLIQGRTVILVVGFKSSATSIALLI
jgi:ABC-type phosphate transport system ATPase subunit